MRAHAIWAACLFSTLAGAQAAYLPPAPGAGSVVCGKVTPKYNTYRVRPGDTLFSIAEKFYGTGHGYWQIIARENNVNPESLKTGMVLKIPVEAVKVDPEAARAAQPAEAPAPSTGQEKKKDPYGTVGDTMDAVAKRIKALTGILGLEFRDGPTYAIKVVLALFLGCMLYVSADALMVWFGSIILRVPETTFSRASRISVSSAGLQLLLVLSLLMLGAVANQIVPDSANVETLRSLSWGARWVWWSAVLSAFLGLFFIPFSMTRQTFSVTAGRAGGVVVTALALKCFIAFFPSAVAFVATGAGVVK